MRLGRNGGSVGYSFGLTLTSWGALAFSVAKGLRGSETQCERSLSSPQFVHPLIGAYQRLTSFLRFIIRMNHQHHASVGSSVRGDDD